MTDAAAVARCARVVVEQPSVAATAAYLAAWPRLVASRDITPATLPVLRWLPEAAANAPPGSLAELAQLLLTVAPALAWRQTYREPAVDARFLERYGWCEVFGLSGPIPSAALACGFLLLGPDTFYPPHSHVAQELYVPISGAAEWRRGKAPFVLRRPGEIVLHASGEPHAMRTHREPLLALYLWRGMELGEAATLGSEAGA